MSGRGKCFETGTGDRTLKRSGVNVTGNMQVSHETSVKLWVPSAGSKLNRYVIMMDGKRGNSKKCAD
jgi:hypothetical protein